MSNKIYRLNFKNNETMLCGEEMIIIFNSSYIQNTPKEISISNTDFQLIDIDLKTFEKTSFRNLIATIIERKSEINNDQLNLLLEFGISLNFLIEAYILCNKKMENNIAEFLLKNFQKINILKMLNVVNDNLIPSVLIKYLKYKYHLSKHNFTIYNFENMDSIHLVHNDSNEHSYIHFTYDVIERSESICYKAKKMNFYQVFEFNRNSENGLDYECQNLTNELRHCGGDIEYWTFINDDSKFIVIVTKL